MMSLPGFQTQLRPSVTLNFDLITTEVDRSCPCVGEDLCQFALKSVHSFSKYNVHKLVTDERTNERTTKRTDGRTKGQVENIMRPASLEWCTDKFSLCSLSVLRSCVLSR